MIPLFEFARPATLSEALELLATKPGAYPVAGGTNLLVDARAGKVSPKTVVDIHALKELRTLEIRDHEIVIGSAVTINDLACSTLIQEKAPVLCAAARSFANELIRHRATIGGNLVNNAPCADTAPALLVLDADVELTSSADKRCLPLEEFLLEPFKTQRRDNELLTSIRFMIPSRTSLSRFRKMGLRRISCMAKVDVAVFTDFDTDGFCREARIALAAASPVACRAHAAEKLLLGQRLTNETIRQSASTAVSTAHPRPGSEYKQYVVDGLVRRLLTEISKEVNAARV